MTRIRITTDRLPQPDRRKGAELDVTPEKAASLVAQGFAEILEPATPVKPEPQPEPQPEPHPEPQPTAAPRRRRVEEPGA